MADVFTVSGEGLTIATTAGGVTLVAVRAATAASSAGGLLKVKRAWANQRGSLVSAMVSIALGRKVTAFGTYTSATPQPANIGGPASAIAGGTTGAVATAGINASAEGAGAFTVYAPDNFNVLNGYLWLPTPDEELQVLPGEMVALMIRQTMAAPLLTLWSFGITFEEVV